LNASRPSGSRQAANAEALAVDAGRIAVASQCEPRIRSRLAPVRRNPLIGFATNHWTDGWTSRRRIMEGLAARGWPALYSSGARTVWDIGEPIWRELSWINGVKRHAGLHLDCPGRLILRWPSHPFWDRLAIAAHSSRLPSEFGGRRNDMRTIALLFHPAFWPYVRHIRPAHVVYYVHDAYRLMPGWTEQLARHERDLAGRADLIVAYSQGMLDGLPAGVGRRGRVLATGVDVQPFESPAAATCPVDLEAIPRPRIGYVGRINQKLDYSVVLDVARRRPQWHWVFIGAIGAGTDGRFAVDKRAESLWSRCRSLQNVHVLGPRLHSEVPSYLLNMDVNAMCYRTDGEGWWSEIFPLKSMEYLAAGKPVVTSPVKSMLQFKDNLAVATSVAEWIDAIEHALVGGGVGTAESRRQVARANSWDQKIDRLEAWIFEMVDSASAMARNSRVTGE
jgi:glycosyltransferase involved in cell wall biosynthesis